MQLYQLVMRAVRESNVFTAAEKIALRRLLVSLVHLVDIRMVIDALEPSVLSRVYLDVTINCQKKHPA